MQPLSVYLFDHEEHLLCIRQDATAFVVQEGELTLSCTFPVEADAVTPAQGMLIGFWDVDDCFTLYEVKQVTLSEPGHTAKVSAEHAAISELLNEIIPSVSLADATAEEVVSAILASTRYTLLSCTAASTATATYYYQNAWECLVDVCAKWQCRIKVSYQVTGNAITGRFLTVSEAAARTTGKRLELWKDIERAEITYDDTEVITALYGLGEGGETTQQDDGRVTYSERITFADLEWSIANGDPADKPKGQTYIEDKAATARYGRCGRPRFGVQIWDAASLPEELLAATWQQLQTICRPNFACTICAKDMEAAYGLAYEAVRVGDQVIAILDEVGVQLPAEVTNIQRDYLYRERTVIEMRNYAQSSVDFQAEFSEQIKNLQETSSVSSGTAQKLPTVSDKVDKQEDEIKDALDKITSNTDRIESNRQSIAANEDLIEINAREILVNAKQIEVNTQQIEVNAGNILLDAELIQANAQDILLKADKATVEAQEIILGDRIEWLDGRVTAAEIDINAAESTIEMKADQTAIEGMLTVKDGAQIAGALGGTDIFASSIGVDLASGSTCDFDTVIGASLVVSGTSAAWKTAEIVTNVWINPVYQTSPTFYSQSGAPMGTITYVTGVEYGTDKATISYLGS